MLLNKIVFFLHKEWLKQFKEPYKVDNSKKSNNTFMGIMLSGAFFFGG